MVEDNHVGLASKAIADYVDIEELQKIQDSCAEALGIALVISDYRGVPVTRMSGFTRHCALGRSDPAFGQMCERCDAFGGIRAATGDSRPCIYRCHVGLVDFAVPIIVDGNYLGAVLGGQVKLQDPPAQGLPEVGLDSDGVPSTPELLAARDQIEPISYERLVAAADTVRILMSHVLADSMSSPSKLRQLVRSRDAELALLRARLDGLMRAQQKRDAHVRRLEEAYQSFFPVMNELHCVAGEEGAVASDSLILDFVDLTRYIVETDCEIVTLGEEIAHVRMLMRVLSVRMPGLVGCDIQVPERLSGVACPFMVLRPIVLAVLRDPWGATTETGCDIVISVLEGGSSLVVRVTQNSLSYDDMLAAVQGAGGQSSFGLAEASSRLGSMGESNPGLVVERRPDGADGCIVQFELPLAARE